MTRFSYLLKSTLTVWWAVLKIVAEEFSLVQLLKTLFAPWRRDITPPQGSLDEILRAFLENIISRTVGFVVRFFTILVCIALEILILVIGAIFFVLILALGPLFSLAITPPPSPPLFLLLQSNPNPTEEKLSQYLEEEAKRVYLKANNPPSFFSEILSSHKVTFILTHLGIGREIISSLSSSIAFSPSEVLQEAARIACFLKNEKISTTDLFYALYLKSPVLSRFFEGLNLKKEDITNLISWEHAFDKTIHRPSVLLHPELYRTSGGIGRLWSAGYTPALDRFSYEIGPSLNLTSPLHFEAHKDIISEVETILSRSGKHNVILVGEAGTGKRTVALGFAQRVIFGKTIPSLAHRRVIELNIDALLAGTKTMGEVEERFVLVLNEAVRAGNIILFIDNIDRLFEQQEGKVGAFDASALLLPYLERTDFQLIGTTTFEGYHKWIQPNSALSSAFEKVEIKEPNKEETLRILEEVALYFESKQKVLILYQALKKIVELSQKYLAEKKFPEKAIDLLDETVSYLITKKKGNILTEKEVEEVVELKTQIPIGEVEISEKEKLLKLEEQIHQRLINQEEAVSAICEALRRARTGLASEAKPIGSFLFLGPTGCGKTETAKTLAEIYYGSEKKIIRFDMSEYQQIETISRLIGGRLGEPGLLTSKVREAPYSLILLDEIEKAHPNILNLFLQVLDEGRLTDSLGKEADFKNTIIIATSNAGAEWIREKIAAKERFDKNEFINFLLQQGYFRPEFLNRFDAVVAFRPLGLEELEKVVDLMIARIAKSLEEKQIKIQLQPEARRKLAEAGFDPQFGARALRRVIQDKVEGVIAKQLLEGTLKPGLTFVINEDILK